MSESIEWTKTTFRLPKALLKEIKHYATDAEKSDTEVFNEALKQFLKDAKKKWRMSESLDNRPDGRPKR